MSYIKIYLSIYFSDGLVERFQKTTVAVATSLAVLLKTVVAVVMRLC